MADVYVALTGLDYKVKGEHVRREPGDLAPDLTDRQAKDLLAIGAVRKATAKDRRGGGE